MTDLDKLIMAVEVGDDGAVTTANRRLGSAAHDVGLLWHGHDVGKAFGGSLDAAQRLHDALLPGWRVHDFSQYSTFWAIVLNGEPPPHFFHGKAETPARAWLLAILRALKAKEDHNGTV